MRPPYAPVALLLLGTIAVSQALPWAGRAFGGNVPPLFARFEPSLGPGIVAALAIAAAGVALVPAALTAPRWALLAATVLLAWLLALALAAQSGGLDAIAAPFRRPLDYFANVPLVASLGPHAFAERYPELVRAGRISLHASTHPPGPVLLLWALSRAAGGSLLAVSSAVALIGACAAVPTYFLARAAYGERAARAAAVLFACAPAVLLFSATSMDAVFMTMVAMAMAAMIRAPRSDGWAVASGLLVALSLLFTYGALGLGPVAVGMGALAWRSTPRPPLVRRAALVTVGLAAGMVVLRLAMGVDLLGSFGASLDAHLSDPSRSRSYWYWLAANLAAFFIAAGVAQTALVVDETRSRWRSRRPGLETVTLATLALASLSGLFRGEVDHIWLFFVPLVAATAGARFGAADGSLPLPGASGGVAWSDAGGLRMAVLVGLSQALLMQVLLYTFW